MPLDLSILANDFRQVSTDLPVSFRYRKTIYRNASFNPGDLSFDPVTGGVLEDVGTATLMYAIADLPKRRPDADDELEVLWQGAWMPFRVSAAFFGHAVATFTLVAREKE